MDDPRKSTCQPGPRPLNIRPLSSSLPCIALITLISLAPLKAAADPAFSAPAGWTVSGAAPQIVYRNPSQSGEAIVFLGPLPTSSESAVEDLRQSLGDFETGFGCPGFAKARVSGDARLAYAEFDGKCAAAVSFSGSGSMKITYVRGDRKGSFAPYFDRALAWTGWAASTGASPSPNTEDKPAPATRFAPESGTLATLLASVPKQNRPLHFIFRTEVTTTGSDLAFQFIPWALFSTGYATDCMDWDPSEVAPTPSDFARSGLNEKGCVLTAWRRSGNSVTFADDGYDETFEIEAETPPARGQTYVFDLVATEYFSTLNSWGAEQRLIVNDSFLKLTRDGRIEIDAATLNWAGRDSTRTREQMVSGTYRVDGYLIAISAGGVTTTRLFWPLKSSDGDQFLAFEGRSYGPR
jgi:hypothetical protein